jgi:DNA-binding winged helix-turn-helix (wHTH) protein/TolB-like protein
MTFGEFEADIASGELRRQGVRVKLQDLPFRVLVLLLSKPGTVVTREELRAELWGASTFVDAEAGLNTAVNKLREALGDSAEAPRFIETLPKRGYRFVGPTRPAAPAVPLAPPAPTRSRRVAVLAASLLAAAVLVGAWSLWHGGLSAGRTVIAVVLFHNETGDPADDPLAQELTDATVVALTANPRDAVIGNAAILRTPRIFADIKTIGETLHAEYLVLGQVQNAGGVLTVRAHLIRTRDETHVWATGVSGDRTTLTARVPGLIAEAVNRQLTR